MKDLSDFVKVAYGPDALMLIFSLKPTRADISDLDTQTAKCY